MRLENQVAIVTGGTSGIGKSIAIRFAREGAKVVVIGRNKERGKAVIEAIQTVQDNAKGLFIQADVTEEADVKAAVEQVYKLFGDIDILVNNAGAMLPGSIPEIDLDAWNFVYQANVTSTYLMSHFTLPYMLERKKGNIINIASEAGLKGFKNRAAYCSAKAAVIGMTKAMAVDHSPLGIRINCICPGTVETPLVQRTIESSSDPEGLRQEFISRRLLPFIGTPEDVAECAVYLASSEARYMTGAIIALDGGASAK